MMRKLRSTRSALSLLQDSARSDLVTPSHGLTDSNGRLPGSADGMTESSIARTLWEGTPASPGIVIAPARVLRMEGPAIPHGSGIPAHGVEAEVERFRDACTEVKTQIQEL